mgnify:CR=1 FL=1
MSQNKYMYEALKLANKAQEINEVPVGCVIVDIKGEIIASGFNTNIRDLDPTAHAEVNAIREACIKLNNERLVGCDLYITLEPCIMCAAVISRAKIRRLYYGADDLIYGAVNGNVNSRTPSLGRCRRITTASPISISLNRLTTYKSL